MDVTLIEPLQLILLKRSAEAPGHYLTVEYNTKYSQYGEACLHEGVVFAPIAVEIFGGWHDTVAAHIKRIGKHWVGTLDRMKWKPPEILSKDFLCFLSGQGQCFSPD